MIDLLAHFLFNPNRLKLRRILPGCSLSIHERKSNVAEFSTIICGGLRSRVRVRVVRLCLMVIVGDWLRVRRSVRVRITVQV